MFKNTLTLSLAAVVLAGSSQAMARELPEPQELSLEQTVQALPGKRVSVADAQKKVAGINVQLPTTEVRESDKRITPASVAALNVETPVALKSSKTRISSASDLTGQWINNHKFFDVSLTGGNTSTITVTEGNNITISNFFRQGLTAKAVVDAEAGTVTIPVQVIATRTDGTTLTIAPVNLSTGYPIRTQPIVLSILEDGSLATNTWWGAFYDRTDPSDPENPGYEKDDYVNVFTNLTFERGTSIMTYTNASREQSYSFPVIASQISQNVIRVKNFMGFGQTVDLNLNRDNTYTIQPQVGYVEGYAAYYTGGDIVYNETGVPTSWSSTFSFPANAETPKVVTPTEMSLFYSKAYWIGKLTDIKLNLNFDPVFPAPFAASFEGEGTEASPYLIKTYNDLAQLAEMVNKDTNLNYTYVDGEGDDAVTVNYARPYLGKYFRLENDLDMTNYDFTPIGVDGLHWFAGTFDGNNHTITGLKVNGNAGYAALFSYLDEAGTIKNLKLDNITVTTSSIYGAALASRSDGTIDNCQVSNSKITVNNGYQGAGAIAGWGNIIKNCTVTNCEVYAGDGYNGGLVGQVIGLVENCHVVDTKVWAMIYNSTAIPPMGGIAATAACSINNSSFSGSVTVPNSYYPARIGGITGALSGLGYGVKLSNSYVVGEVSGSLGSYSNQNRIGGLVGTCAADISNCYSSGVVAANKCPYAGTLTGLVQYMKNSTTGEITQPTFSNCYSSAWLNVGAVTYTPSATTCMELFGNSDPENPPVISNCYFDSQINTLGSTICGATTAQLTTAAGPEGLSSENWTFAQNAYPVLKNQPDTKANNLSASAVLFPAGTSTALVNTDVQLNPVGETQYGFIVDSKFTKTGRYAKIEGNTLKINQELKFGTDTICAVNGTLTKFMPLMIAPTPWEGEGTEANPWLITTKADMIALGKMTSESMMSFPGTYYKMTADIDMEYDDAFNGVSYTNTNSQAQFHATFDGDGHTFHNLKIGLIVWTVKPEDDPNGRGTVNTNDSRATFIGLFGVIAKDGVVKNVNIAADCKYDVFASAGAIAGINYGLIENCRNYADINAQSAWIGGIFGQDAKEAVTRNCYNAGNITCGWGHAGGITGCTYSLVENCANTGNVTIFSGYYEAGKNQLKYAGGIAGWINAGRIVNCYNAGYIYAPEGNSGGITGSSTSATSAGSYTNDMMNNVNVGIVASGVPMLLGGISGAAGTKGTISNNFYDAQLNPEGAMESTSVTGMYGLSTAEMIEGIELGGLDSEIWNFTEGLYPAPIAFLNEPKLAASRKVYVLFGEGESRSSVSTAATLSTSTGLTWTLAESDNFKIADGKLVPPADGKSIVYDTLTGYLDGYVKQIPLMWIPAAPWDGEGTAENPWQLKTTNDWNNIAMLMSQTGNTYEGKYFQVMNDIDFTDKEFDGIAVAPVQFMGTIDGGNFSIKNFEFNYEGGDYYQAPVGVLGAAGVLKNLTMAGTVNVNMTKGSYSYAGGIVGQNYGKLTNVTNASNVTANKSYVAGIAGMSYGGAVYTDCVNKGTIQTTASAGYIAGIVANAKEGNTFVRCHNEGTLTSTGSTGTIGGIVATCAESTFTDCYNSADIDLEKISTIGGLIGQLSGSKTAAQKFEITGCYNTGNIRGKAIVAGIYATCGNAAGAGIVNMSDCYNTGIISAASTSTSSNAPGAAGLIGKYAAGSTYKNCYNTGKIVIEAKAYQAGGIAGCVGSVGTATLPTIFENCWNSGEVVGSTDYSYWLGGIVGHCNAYVYVKNCYNTGEVSGMYSAGGIAGAVFQSAGLIENCWNSADITVATRFAGGIVGSQGVTNANTASWEIANCWNSGAISTTATGIGTTTTTASTDGHGIGGIAGQVPCVVRNCANFGPLSGATFVAGIVGEPVLNKTAKRTTITGCYNAGTVKGLEGGLTGGICVTSNDTFWNANNTITDSYYVKEFCNAQQEIDGTPLTISELTKKEISDSWTLIAENTFPVPVTMKTDTGWKCMAATLVPAEGETYAAIRNDFKVGVPEDVEWSIDSFEKASSINLMAEDEDADTLPLTIEDGEGTWSKSFVGLVTLKATCGSNSKTISFNAEVEVKSGIDSLDAENESHHLYFTANGLQTSKPSRGDGNVYIVVTHRNDGTVKVTKLLNK